MNGLEDDATSEIITRHEFLRGCICLGLELRFAVRGSTSRVLVQSAPFALRLVRDVGSEELMGRNQYALGSLYQSDSGFSGSALGTRLCGTLKLPYRNDFNEISSVPKGEYAGYVRSSGTCGWRIELRGTGRRENIQVHVGNQPTDTIGCVLVGAERTNDTVCSLLRSAEALRSIRAAYSDGTNRRAVVLRIQ
jgi:hypothetical protein